MCDVLCLVYLITVDRFSPAALDRKLSQCFLLASRIVDFRAFLLVRHMSQLSGSRVFCHSFLALPAPFLASVMSLLHHLLDRAHILICDVCLSMMMALWIASACFSSSSLEDW